MRDGPDWFLNMKIFFLVGVWRSGTTLLQSMLNSHPDIAMPPESHFVQKYVAPQVRSSNTPVPPMAELADILGRDEHLSRLNIDPLQALLPFQEGERSFSYAALFQEYLKIYLKRTGKSIIGEKDPSNSEYLEEISQAFPDAYIFHIIRDPRDVALSNMKRRGGKNRALIQIVYGYRRILRNVRFKGPELFGDRYTELRFEDLVTYADQQLKPLCAQLDVSYHPSMLNYMDKAKEIVTEDEMAWKGNVFKPPMKENIGKWRAGMKRWQVCFVEEICGEVLDAFGYTRSNYRIFGVSLFSRFLMTGLAVAMYLKKLLLKTATAVKSL